MKLRRSASVSSHSPVGTFAITVVTAAACVVLAVALFSCRGCRDSGPTSIRELAATDAGAAFVADDFGKLVNGTREFLTKLTTRGGAASFTALRGNLQKQLGIDPFDAKSYEAWGIDTKGGVIIFTEAQNPLPILAVTVADPKKFDTAFTAFVNTNDGANKLSTEPAGPYTVQLAGRPFGTEVAPAVAWAHVGRFVLVARAEARPALQAALLRLAQKASAPNAQAQSLATNAAFNEMVAKLPPGDVLLYARGDTAALAGSAAGKVGRTVATSLTLNGTGLSADVHVGLDMPGLDVALAGAAPAALLGRVADDAVVLGVSNASRPEALAVLRTQPALSALIDQASEHAKSEVDLDPEKDILPLLAGPVTLSVHLEKLDGAMDQMQRRPSLDNLLDFIHVVATAELKDPKAMAGLLERSRTALAKRGVGISRHDEKIGGREVTIYLSDVPKTAPKGTPSKLGWAIFDNLYVYAAGAGRLSRQLTLLSGGSGAPLAGKLAGSSAKLFDEKGASVAVLRAGVLADRARALGANTSSTNGMEAMVGIAVELLSSLGDIGVSVAGESGGLRLKLREQLQ